MKQGEKEIYILIYIFSLYNIMSKRSNVDNAEANKKFMAEYQERQQQRLQQQQRQQQSSSYKTPNNRITKFSQGNPNVSKKRRNDGKLKAPIPKKLLTKDIRENRLTHRPTNPNAARSAAEHREALRSSAHPSHSYLVEGSLMRAAHAVGLACIHPQPEGFPCGEGVPPSW